MYPVFDVSRVCLQPLQKRVNDLKRGFITELTPFTETIPCGLQDFAEAMLHARETGASCVLLMGAHVLRAGVQHYLFSMMEQGFISGIAVNGAAAIHDFELALIGETTESVARYIVAGEFGLWQETGRINDIVHVGAQRGMGFGEALGKAIAEGDFPFREDSLFAEGYRLGIPITVHASIGYDIIHAHPNCDGAGIGKASYRDFLIFAKLLENLEGGCVGTFGSAVMAPEVFLKALSMVRNVAAQEHRSVSHFMSLVCDVQDLPKETTCEASKQDARYYFRPWKTLLSRTVSHGGSSCYVRGRHETTIPALWTSLQHLEKKSRRSMPHEK